MAAEVRESASRAAAAVARGCGADAQFASASGGREYRLRLWPGEREGGCRERIRTAHRTAPRNRTHPSRLRPASQPLFTSYASTRGSTTDSSSSRRPPYWIPRRQIQRTGRSGLSAGARRQRSLRQHWRRPQSLALDRRQTEGDRVGSGYRRRRGGSAPAKRKRSGRDCALRCSSRPTKSATPFLRIHSQSPGSASRRR